MDGVFFITGLPRSRTAWMANLMTGGACFCHHDLWYKANNTLEPFCQAVYHTGTSWVGVSDPLNVLHAESLATMFPRAPWLILKRDIEKVQKSWVKLGLDERGLHLFFNCLAVAQSILPNVREIDLDQASDEEIFDACQFLVPSFWDWRAFQRRIAQLRELNVQVHDLPNRIVQEIRRREMEIAHGILEDKERLAS